LLKHLIRAVFRVFSTTICTSAALFFYDMIYAAVEGKANVMRSQPEVSLTPKEAELLQATERGERPCPNPECGLPLHGETLIVPGIYAGILLFCPKEEGGCGFREL
jgi:hypothetical protein